MYAAFVLLTFVARPAVILTDTRGPYAAEPECLARVEAMTQRAGLTLPGLTHVEGTCVLRRAKGTI